MKHLVLLILCLSLSAQAVPILHSGPFDNKLWMDCTTHPWNVSDDIIKDVWERVKLQYKDFKVDVTTEFPGSVPNAARVIIGGPLLPDPTGQFGGIAGQATVGVWTFGTLYSQFGEGFAAYVYADGLNNDPVAVAIAICHEAAHTYGEYHVPTGIMAPAINVGVEPTWEDGLTPQGTYQYTYQGLGNTLGLVPEPCCLLLLSLAFGRRKWI